MPQREQLPVDHTVGSLTWQTLQIVEDETRHHELGGVGARCGLNQPVGAAELSLVEPTEVFLDAKPRVAASGFVRSGLRLQCP